MKMNIKPFHFKLKKVSAKEQRVLSALFDFLPKTGIRMQFREAIEEALLKHLGTEARYCLETVSQGDFELFADRMPDPAVLVVLGMPPREGKIILEIDDHLVSLVIEKLLGGTAETIPVVRSLSDTEQGVLQYLLLQVLAHVYRLCGQDARLHFRFEKFVFSPKGLHSIIAPDESASLLTVRVTIDKHSGFIRLLLPSPLIEQLYLNIEAKGEAREGERAYTLARLKEFGYVLAHVWAEGGYTTVTAGELKNLEVGDVILFDETGLTLGEKGPNGRAVLRVEEGRHGGFISDISVERTKLHCSIVDVQKGEKIHA